MTLSLARKRNFFWQNYLTAIHLWTHALKSVMDLYTTDVYNM